MFWPGVGPPNLLSLGGQGTVSLDPTSIPTKWHLNPSNSLSRGHECDRRQTDRETRKCVAIGRIACTAR